MKKSCLIIMLVFMGTQLFSQEKYLTKEGYISFFSHSLVEDIKADNEQVLSIIDSESGEIAIQLLMRSFLFKKALMQQHFNESYVESHKFPKALFKGTILNFEDIEDQPTEREIKGMITIHGIEKEISIIGKIEKKHDQILLSGEFMVEVADFNIKIPAVVRNNIAEIIKVSFNLNHKPYKN